MYVRVYIVSDGIVGPQIRVFLFKLYIWLRIGHAPQPQRRFQQKAESFEEFTSTPLEHTCFKGKVLINTLGFRVPNPTLAVTRESTVNWLKF